MRNLDALAKFPLNPTCFQYLVLLYGVQLLMLICTAAAAMCAWFLCPTVRTACVAGAAALGLPALLTALGVKPLQWFSPLIPVSSAELLQGLGAGSWTMPFPG